jgi:hypothetical protein
MNTEILQKRLRTSSILVAAGLVVEASSLGWQHPTAFLLFVMVGGGLMAAGILFYLHSLVTRGG